MVNPIVTSDNWCYQIVCLDLGYIFDEAMRGLAMEDILCYSSTMLKAMAGIKTEKQLTAHSSQLTAHSSQLTAHSSQLTL
jgi:hypothetical protein